ncbi:hypothetical protein [Mailhella sp.]|uniref:hypothetical protein n=1 Tax=Mailhella sp. TaxID=1981029 RepID=UPI0040630EA9
MNSISDLWKPLRRWSSIAVIGAALLAGTPCSSSAAPNQERLNRPQSSLRETRSHDFKAERDRSQAERADKNRRFSAERPHHKAQAAFSDRAFLSASLAREETALSLAREVLREPAKGGSQIETWAKQVRDSAEENSLLLEKALHAEGGIDRHAYGKARKALEAQNLHSPERSAPARFIMFLFPYCEQTMRAAIPALLESPQEDVSALAADLLIERAKLSLEIRRWLHAHHYRNDI